MNEQPETPRRKGVIRRTAGLVRREASFVFGTEHIRLGWRAISSQWARTPWARSTGRICPVCGKGRLHPFAELIDGVEYKFLGCSQCDYFQRVKLNGDAVALRRLRGVMMEKIEAMPGDEYGALVRKYQVASRWLYVFSALAVLFGVIYFVRAMSSSGAGGDTALSFLSIITVGVFLFIQGLIASYRHWQLRERVFFRPGAFGMWVRSGQWLV